MLVNTASYRINLAAMEAALAAGTHYVDLGGLFHVTREQVGLDDRFREAGLLAVLGMGSTPGKTNVMAARAVELLGGRVERIVVAASGRDPEPPPGPLVAPYAVETILDELTMPTPVVRDGEVRMLEPMTPAGVVEFGDPVGPAETVFTIHSEMATFPESFGARDVGFQLSLDPTFLAKVRLLAELGLASTDAVAGGRRLRRSPPAPARADPAAAAGRAVPADRRRAPDRGVRPGRGGGGRVRDPGRGGPRASAAASRPPPARPPWSRR